MAEGPPRRRGARPLGDLISGLVDPIVAKKAGMTSGLLSAWPEIVGPRLSDGCRPAKLVWPRRRHEDDPLLPATLIVACEGAFVLRLQHQAGEVVARVNSFFGYPAVAKLKIEQRPVALVRPNRKPATRPLTASDRQTIASATARIENPRLKAALERFGESVLGRNAASDMRPGRNRDRD